MAKLSMKNASCFMNIVQLLKKLDLDEKEIRIYLLLLSLGPSSIRKLSASAGINRGTTFDILKRLTSLGFVSPYQRDKHQYFITEDPATLEKHLDGRITELVNLRERTKEILPELRFMYSRGGGKPIARYFEGVKGIRSILEDILDALSQEKKKEYYVYSAPDIRDSLYRGFPDFTEQRIKRGISVKVISLSKASSQNQDPLSERKWILRDGSSKPGAAYTVIFSNKTACISTNPQGEIYGVMVEDEAIAAAQKLVFEKLWASLETKEPGK